MRSILGSANTSPSLDTTVHRFVVLNRKYAIELNCQRLHVQNLSANTMKSLKHFIVSVEERRTTQPLFTQVFPKSRSSHRQRVDGE